MTCEHAIVAIDHDVSLGTQALADAHRQVFEKYQRPVLQQCADCSIVSFPPQLRCRACASMNLQWHVCVSGLSVATWVTVHGGSVTPSMSVPRRLQDSLPFATVFLNVDEHPGVRIAALYFEGSGEVPDGDLRVGAAAMVECHDVGGRLLPVCLSIGDGQ